MFGSRSFLRRQPVRVLLTSLIFSGMAANGAPPAWWSAGDRPLWDETRAEIPGVNKGVANIGQAKHMVQRALETLESIDEDLADEIRIKLTTPQPSAINPSQTNPAVLNLAVPSPKTPEWIAKQKAPLLIGQLKAIAKPFYDVLHAEHPAWLETQLLENQTKDTANPSNHYPWSSATGDDQNKAAANIGQLKAVFSLPLEELNPNDSDGDGMPNAWEIANGLDPNDPSDAGTDADGDGLSNLREFQLGTNPKNRDTDGDYVLDGDEVTIHSTNPLSAVDSDNDGVPDDWELANGVSNGAGDQDDDGLIDSQEFAHGGNPGERDTDDDGMDDGPEFLAGFNITNRDENNNTLSDGYEDHDNDTYITREEVLCRTNPHDPLSYPDGSAAHGDPDGSGGEPPVLLVRDYHFDHQSVRAALLWKQGDIGYLGGSVNEPPLQVPPAPPTEDDVEMELDDRPKYYLKKTTVESANEQYEWQLTAAGLANPINEYTAYSDEISGTKTTNQITKKVGGDYITESSVSGSADLTSSESTRFDGPIVTETLPPRTFNFSSQGPLPSWVSGFATTGDAVPKILSDTEERTEYKKKINEVSESATEEWNYNNSRVVTLSDVYTDGHLVEDLKSELEAEEWGAVGFSNLVGLFLWDRFSSDRPHQYASLQDNRFRLVANNVANVASNATVKFHWKEVFVPQGGRGEIQTRWLSASGSKLTSGTYSGRYATVTHDLMHPDEPGETYAVHNQSHISAPEELSAVNPGEELFYKREFADSNGVQKTDIVINRGKPIRFQVDLADQKSNPTLELSGSGAVTLWERKKNGIWFNHSFPFKIPAEQAAGNSSDSGRYVLQGAAAGSVTLKIKVGGAVRDSFILQVRRVDLDVDSDNSGDVNMSTAEEKVEFDAKKGGMVLPAGPASASDENGIPLHPDQLGTLMIKLANSSAGESFKIIYPQEILRIWKSAPGIPPDSEDLLQSGHAYSVAELGLSPSGDAILSIQPLLSVSGLVRIEVSCGDASDGVLVNLLPFGLGVDKNRDGGIALSSAEDNTSDQEPYRFWINNDYDDFGYNTYDPKKDNPWNAEKDLSDKQINMERDLDDFARLHLQVGSIQHELQSGAMSLGFKWVQATSGSPKIRLFRATAGGLGYLSSGIDGLQQIGQDAKMELGVVAGSDPLFLPASFWQVAPGSSFSSLRYLLFEGVQEGKGRLGIVIKKGTQVIAEGGEVHLDLVDIRRMYERWRISETVNIPHPAISSLVSGVDSVTDAGGFSFVPAWDEDVDDKSYVICIHGWNKSYLAARSDEITIFKRMWHQGFKGRFAGFYWPTEEGFLTYNSSEYRAWKCGDAFKDLVMNQLSSTYKKNVIAHSMGNVVASSALSQGAEFNSYALLNAAVPAQCFDPDPALKQAPVTQTYYVESTGDVLEYVAWRDRDLRDDSLSWIRGLSYLDKAGEAIVGDAKLINFHLSDDLATKDAWEANNWWTLVGGFNPILSKPIAGYSYVRGTGVFYDNGSSVRGGSDTHEVMSMVNQSKTKAAGAESRTAGSVKASVDLNGENMEFDREHEAIFKYVPSETWEFYRVLLFQLGYIPNP